MSAGGVVFLCGCWFLLGVGVTNSVIEWKRRRALNRATGYPTDSVEARSLVAAAVTVGGRDVAVCADHDGHMIACVQGQWVKLPPLGVLTMDLPGMRAEQPVGTARSREDYARAMQHVPEDPKCSMHWALDPSVRAELSGYCEKCDH